MLVTEENYEQVLSDLCTDGEIVCDTETTGLEWAKDSCVCGVGLLSSDTPHYFPFRHEEGRNLPVKKLEELTERVLRPDRVHVGFNYKFDIHMLLKEGMRMPRRIEDSQLSAHLLNENEPSFKMESLAERYLDSDAGKEEEELLQLLQDRFGGAKSKAKSNLWRLPPELVAEYACKDLTTTRDLRDLHRRALGVWKSERFFEEACEYSLVLTALEERGLLLNLPRIEQFMEEAERNSQACKDRAAQLAGYPINLNSSKQCQAWLGVASSAKDILAPMVEKGDERATLLKDFRVWSKANANYYRPFLAYMGANGLLHPNLNMVGTVIRLSCSNPNLQAIPVDTNKYKVKQVFASRPGYVMFEADLSQAEVRVMAHYTRDPMLLEIIETGVSMHDKVASEQNLPRDVAKRLNFSAQYGIGAKKFAKTYGYPLHQSKEYLAKYHRMFPGMRRLYDMADRKAQNLGYIRLYTGKPQHFDGRKSPSHKASSRIIQGAVAEMIRIAQCRLEKEVPEALQLLQVHDSIVGEIPENRVSEIVPEIKRVMCDQPWCSVPVKVDVKIGPSWGEAREVK